MGPLGVIETAIGCGPLGIGIVPHLQIPRRCALGITPTVLDFTDRGPDSCSIPCLCIPPGNSITATGLFMGALKYEEWIIVLVYPSFRESLMYGRTIRNTQSLTVFQAARTATEGQITSSVMTEWSN